jgi:transposase
MDNLKNLSEQSKNTAAFVADTANNTATTFQNAGKNARQFITKNAQNIASKIGDTGQKVLNNIKENPLSYVAGAGVAALTAGIIVGRVSKENEMLDKDTEEALLYVKTFK